MPSFYMKKASPSSWKPRSYRDQHPSLDAPNSIHHPSAGSHQVPLSPSYTSPRRPPEFPLYSQKHLSSFNKGFNSVFNRKPTFSREFSTLSVHSDPSVSSQTSLDHHPYGNMAPAPLPVVSSHDAIEDEAECPVCLEPLSFSFRLPGEKPHIVPECGHALHEVSKIHLLPQRWRSPLHAILYLSLPLPDL